MILIGTYNTTLPYYICMGLMRFLINSNYWAISSPGAEMSGFQKSLSLVEQKLVSNLLYLPVSSPTIQNAAKNKLLPTQRLVCEGLKSPIFPPNKSTRHSRMIVPFLRLIYVSPLTTWYSFLMGLLRMETVCVSTNVDGDIPEQ